LKIIKESIATGGGASVSMFFHFISIMLLARALSKDEFGIYALILVIINFLNIISGFGLEITSVKFIASEDESKSSEIISQVFLYRFFLLIFFLFSVFILSRFIFDLFGMSNADLTLFVIVLTFLFSFRDLFYNLIQGKRLFVQYASIQVTSAILRVALLFTLNFYNALNLKNLLLIEIISVSLVLIWQGLLLNLIKRSMFFINVVLIKNLTIFSFKLYLTSIVTFIYDRVSFFILGLYLTPVSIANFDISTRIPQASLKVFQSFIVVYFPSVSKLFTEDSKNSAHQLINKSLINISLLISFLVLGITLFNKEIITIIFSEKYLDISLAFVLMMFSFLFRALSNLLGYALVSANKPNYTLIVNIISSVLSLVIAFFLIPRIGLMGAVYSALCANLSSLVFHNFYANKLKFEIKSLSYSIYIFITIAFLGITLLLDINVLYVKILILLVYLLIGYILSDEFRKILITIWNKAKFAFFDRQ